MKLSHRRKNARLTVAGIPFIPRGTDDFDPDLFVLNTMTRLKQLDPATLTPDLREQVDRWTPPRFRCLSCPATGLLSTCPRIPNREWRCPRCLMRITHDPVT